MLQTYRISDQGDFWAFFYQCWSILPISLKLKLKTVSQRLLREAPLGPDAVPVGTTEFRYTPVLTKQSAMFNAWKLLCEIAEGRGAPVRLASMYSVMEIEEGKVKADKIRRYEAVSLEHFYRGINA
jgi:hypothetical protein